MVLQREINTFILDTFGKYLKPAILDAIRREVDPSFSEARFEELFKASLPAGLGLAAIIPAAAPGAVVGALPAAAPGGTAVYEPQPRDRWPYLEVTDPKKVLDASAKLARESFRQQRRGPHSSVLSGRGTRRAFSAGLSQRQKLDNIAGR